MVSRRQERKRIKRKKRRKTIFSIFILFLIGIASFFIYEYQAGKNAAEQAMGENGGNSQFEKEFNGAEELEDDKINVLLLGSDLDSNGTSRTDTIMIGQYDVEHERAKLVSIMRDTYVQIPGHGYNKINAAFALGGPELLRQTIKQNFGIELNYYAIVNFKGFENIVDTIAPDGIEIDVEKRMRYSAKDVNIDLYPGVQTLNGEQLLDYARFRNDAESDFGRVRRQQQVMSALKEEVLSFTSLMKLPRAIGTLQPYIDTNMETSKVLSVASEFFLNTPNKIETMRIPLDDTWTDPTYSGVGTILKINLEENKAALNEFLTSQPRSEDYTQSEETDEETNTKTDQQNDDY